MRPPLISFFALCLLGAARADVVIENAGADSGGRSQSSGVFSLTFSASTSFQLSKMTLNTFIAGTDLVRFTLAQSGGPTVSQDITSTSTSGGLRDFVFTTIAGQVISGNNWTLTIGENTGNFGLNQDYVATLNNTVYTTNFLSGGVTQTSLPVTGGGGGNQYLRFTLEGTAVPEPGTLFLGGVAALAGGAGAWRRKRKKTQAL